MDTTLWYRTQCPGCNKVNWVYAGEPCDLSEIDVQGFTCWKCGDSWDWDGYHADLTVCEEGVKTP